jgi:hypothetical protein
VEQEFWASGETSESSESTSDALELSFGSAVLALDSGEFQERYTKLMKDGELVVSSIPLGLLYNDGFDDLVIWGDIFGSKLWVKVGFGKSKDRVSEFGWVFCPWFQYLKLWAAADLIRKFQVFQFLMFLFFDVFLLAGILRVELYNI